MGIRYIQNNIVDEHDPVVDDDVFDNGNQYDSRNRIFIFHFLVELIQLCRSN